MAAAIIEDEAPNECVISQFLYPGNWFPEREETLASDTEIGDAGRSYHNH